ncbi:MAG: type II toxin-antitoxin system RelE/ParE family toxin [Pseudomonadota bacterium]|nr:type II toxin-antitoxin system RelE/ParE family toxin [Pseudomonadota bacterium]
MKVIWTPEAEQDRDDIWVHVAADNLRAAARLDELFSDAAARLVDHPKLGRSGKIPGTREWIAHENYRLVYEIDGETVWVLTLVHTARQWPPARG